MSFDPAKYPKEILERLTRDEDFQKIVSADKELASLYATPEKTAEESELEFYAVMGGRFSFPNGVFKPISAGVISLLSLFSSPFVTRNKTISPADVDLAMLIMCSGKDVLDYGDMTAIRTASEGFCTVLELDYTDAASCIIKAIRISFLGLSYIMGSTPQTGNPGEDNNPLDVEWLVRQISMSHDICGYPPEVTKWELSMCELSYISCQMARKAGRIISRPKKADLVFNRLHNLMDERIESYKAKK